VKQQWQINGFRYACIDLYSVEIRPLGHFCQSAFQRIQQSSRKKQINFLISFETLSIAPFKYIILLKKA
jgi:hypothetical protein